jgi:L-ascorbate metabolism protein UlaG (beta-lactamase superfamily)
MNERHKCNEKVYPLAISRRKFLWMAAAGLLAACCPPQRQPSADEEPTDAEPTNAPTATSSSPTGESEPGEDLPAILGRLHWLGHASFRLDGPPVIYFDPVNIGSEPPPADIILISHPHDDHFSMPDVKLISGPETVIITIQDIAGAVEELEDVVYAEVRAAQLGERMTVGSVEIETVPAYNIDKSYHPKEAGYLGFIVTLQGERLYFAGDTDRIPEMASIECDVALLPVGGTYTMDIEEAAQAAADIGPKVAVPMHDRGADLNAFSGLCECPVVVMEIE